MPKDERPMKDKALSYISFAIIGMALALVGLLLYWRYEPSDVYQVKGDTIAVNTQEIRAGGNVILNFSFCKKLDVQGEVKKDFISSFTEISSPSTYDKLGKTCVNNAKVPVPVPPQAASGEYRIRYIGTYKVNPIKTVKEEYYSEPFLVIGRDQGVQGIQGIQGVQGVEGIQGETRTQPTQ